MYFESSSSYIRFDQKVHIYSDKILSNLSNLKGYCRNGAKFCAVIKSDGYGHGLRIMADILKRGGVDFFAVANVYEAEAIFDIAGETKILILEPLHTAVDSQAVKLCAKRGFHCAIVDSDALEFVQSVLWGSSDVLNLHVKVETGMGRCGVDEAKAAKLIAKISEYKNVKLAGVYTHFSTAAEKDLAYAQGQLERFNNFISAQSIKDNKDVIVHAASSAAMLNMPYAHFDMVRCGIAVFGWPEHRYAIKIALEPVMKFEVPIVQLNNFKKGQTVGYARTFTAARDTVGAIVPVGYADNYWRLYSNRAVMRIDDDFAGVIGRVSMDKCVIDVTDLPQAKVGKYVTVIDNDPTSRCSVYRLAELADTICHEILTSLPPKAERIIH